jgi:pimeloyl-ACP methyl ester carboxylesterase
MSRSHFATPDQPGYKMSSIEGSKGKMCYLAVSVCLSSPFRNPSYLFELGRHACRISWQVARHITDAIQEAASVSRLRRGTGIAKVIIRSQEVGARIATVAFMAAKAFVTATNFASTSKPSASRSPTGPRARGLWQDSSSSEMDRVLDTLKIVERCFDPNIADISQEW